MRHRVSLALIVALAAGACDSGGSAVVPQGGEVAVSVGHDLGLTAADRIIPEMSVGVWRVDLADERATIFERHLSGDEAAAGHRIVIDFGQDPPAVIELVATSSDAEGKNESVPIGPGDLRLQDANPGGVISGEYEADSGRTLRFWVDTAAATYVESPALETTFDLRPGGVADSFRFATQFVEVVEDSRCPPGAECVWAGQVVVRMRYISESGAEEFELTGFQTPDGPAYGDAPTHPATMLPFSSLAIALVGLEDDVSTFMWFSTEQ